MIAKMKLKHWIIGIIIIVLDQLTKILLINKNFVIIPNFLKLTYTENNGAAFGIGTRYIIMIISILIIVGIIIYMIHERKKGINYIPCVLVLSGSVANLIDRIFRGFVVDYIDINLFNFPNFNIADICITVGIVLLIINILKNNIKEKRKL